MELGEFSCEGEEDEQLEMICCEINNCDKAGIIVQGIEVDQTRKELDRSINVLSITKQVLYILVKLCYYFAVQYLHFGLEFAACS